MCSPCTGTPQTPSQALAAIHAKRSTTTKVVPHSISPGIKSEHFSIPKEIKEQLIRQQQLARIPQKTG